MSELSEAVKRHIEEKKRVLVKSGELNEALRITLQAGTTFPRPIGLDELALAECRGIGRRSFLDIMEVYGSADAFLKGGLDHLLYGDKRWPPAREELGRWIRELRRKGYGPTGGDHG